MSSYFDRLKVRLKVLIFEILSCKSSYEIIKIVFKVHRLELFTRKKDILTSLKRPKWPIRQNKRLHLKCFLVFENKSK